MGPRAGLEVLEKRKTFACVAFEPTHLHLVAIQVFIARMRL